jgi:putative NIF3 family GTP cyclohydrolase 1 type 2
VDAFLTADLRHHPASEAREAGGFADGRPALLDAAHWATERPWLDDVAEMMRTGLGIDAVVSDLDTDPWTVHAPSPATPNGAGPSDR